MARHLPPLRSLLAFESIARNLSVTAAAEELNLTPSAISHRLKSLEDYLGTSLFHRANRRMTLTEAGLQYLFAIDQSFEKIERSSDRILGHRATDTLTIVCPAGFGLAWLLDRIGDFMQRHPDIDVRVLVATSQAEFFRTEIDVEIRIGKLDWTGLVVEPFLPDFTEPMCSPGLLAQIDTRDGAEALKAAELIWSEHSPLPWRDWFRLNNSAFTPARGLRFDHPQMALEAACRGLGIALESAVCAEGMLREGRLVPVFSEGSGRIGTGSYALVFPPAFGEIPKIRAFSHWLHSQVETGKKNVVKAA